LRKEEGRCEWRKEVSAEEDRKTKIGDSTSTRIREKETEGGWVEEAETGYIAQITEMWNE